MTKSLFFDEIDRKIVVATQSGLPLVERPFAAVAYQVGISPEEVVARFCLMQEAGIIRRIAAVPNHYRLGYMANGMSVWEVPLACVDEAGHKLAMLDYVSHCYRRPACLPIWPYTLFAMVHARSRDEIHVKVSEMAEHLASLSRSHTVLFSSRILKKTGLRLQTTTA